MKRPMPMHFRSGLKRTADALALLLCSFAAVAGAQNQRPLPRGGPEGIVAPFRVHVRVHESLDVDRLRDLARPNVTLWLSTKSNTLKTSTLENLARFDTVWVQLRSPIKAEQATPFTRVPRAGLWLSSTDLKSAGRLPGARPLAVSLEGAIDESIVAQLNAAHVKETVWASRVPLDVLSWGLFKQLPGRRVVVAGPSTLLPVTCGDRTPSDPSVELHVANLLALSSDVFPCGTGTRVVVEPAIEPWLIQSLVARDPSVELVIEVGADAARAIAARKLLETLELGASR